MGFTTGIAVPLFLFVASMTCDSSFGQYGPWNGPQTYAENRGSGYNNGMWYNGAGGNRQMGGSARAAAYGGGNGGMAFGGTSAAAGSSAGGFSGGAADAGASSGAEGFSSGAADTGGMGGGAAGNGGSSYSSAGSGAAGFGPASLGNIPVGLNPAPLGNAPGGFGPAPLDKVLPGFGGVAVGMGSGGFVGDQGSAPEAAAGPGPVVYDGGAGGVALPANAVGGRRNGKWKSGLGRPGKLIKPTILSRGFSLDKILPFLKNACTSSYLKLSFPDSQKRIAKCSGLFQSAGFSLGSIYMAYFALYNDIAATHGEMSFIEAGILAFLEMVFSILKFLKATPFACALDVAKTFDYVSLLYKLLGLLGCDDVCIAKWSTYANSAFS